MIRWSGQQDLNLRPSGPKPDALPDCALARLDLARLDLARLDLARLDLAHILVGEPVTSPDRVRARLSSGYALRGSLRYKLRSWLVRRVHSDFGPNRLGPGPTEPRRSAT